jgi:hypothetical protein
VGSGVIGSGGGLSGHKLAVGKEGQYRVIARGHTRRNAKEPGKTSPTVVEYESGYDRMIARLFPVVTLCQYAVCRFSAPTILDTLKMHEDTFRYAVPCFPC